MCQSDLDARFRGDYRKLSSRQDVLLYSISFFYIIVVFYFILFSILKIYCIIQFCFAYG